MATQQFLVQTPNVTFRKNSPGSLTILTKTPAGVAIDVSAGYTLQNMKVTNNPFQFLLSPSVDIAADVTAAFSTTGVTISWTAAQSATIAGALTSLNNSLYVNLSDDAGATHSCVAEGTFNADPLSMQVG